jgi:hypothetical protein
MEQLQAARPFHLVQPVDVDISDLDIMRSPSLSQRYRRALARRLR